MIEARTEEPAATLKPAPMRRHKAIAPSLPILHARSAWC